MTELRTFLPFAKAARSAAVHATKNKIACAPRHGQGVIAIFRIPSRWLAKRSYAASISSSLKRWVTIAPRSTWPDSIIAISRRIRGLPPSSGPVELLVHGRPLVHWDEAFRRWRPVSQRTVRPDGVVVSAPLLDQDPGLAEREEDLAVEELVAESGVNGSQCPFSQGDPGSMKAVLAPTAPIQSRTF